VAHGVSLPTQDIDVCCRFTPENLLRLQGAIADLHPVHRMVPSRPTLSLTEEACASLRNLSLDTDWGQIDCLGEVLGVGDYQDVVAQSVPVELAGGVCRILSIDALIRAKEAMGRQRDREAALQLRAIRERQGGRSGLTGPRGGIARSAAG
jgi:hypothetical protein